MGDPVGLPSRQLSAANRRLLALRAQVRKQRAGGDPSWKRKHVPAEGESRPLCDRRLLADTADLPAHLGWESDAVTAVLRRRTRICSRGGQQGTDGSCTRSHLTETGAVPIRSCSSVTFAPPGKANYEPGNTQPAPNWVKLYPDIGLGMLRRDMTAPGRLWLLLRYLDKVGEGKLRIDIVKQSLTSKPSNLYLCGQRQLRNLLRDGEEVFWGRDEEHIWLRSAAKVAHALEIDRLTGQPVALPLSALLNGIGTFRAHLYAAFHSGRTKETPRGTQANPIARDTLSSLSGVGRASQRTYEGRAGVKVQANFAIGTVSTKESKEDGAWRQGRALFELKDYRGQQGKKGKTYLAWQLPNTYIGQHQKRPRGRQKRINRELKDLVMKGMPGNAEGTKKTRRPEKVYYPNGKLAAKAYGRRPEQQLFWRRHRTRNGRFELWQQLGGG